MGGRSLLDLSCEIMEITLPEEVRTEIIRNFTKRDKETWEHAHDALVRLTRVIKKVDPNCLKFFEDWLRKHGAGAPLSVSRRIELGERQCAALGLKEMIDGPISLNMAVTDDVSARVAMDAFFQRQGVGYAVSTPELIILLLNRIGRVTKDQAIRALNEYYTRYVDNPKRPLKPSYVADIQACWREI
jgi:hypothetical protein